MTSPVPANELSRLEALRQYRILDTAPEQVFDDITSLAAYICQVPIALIVLVDRHRQWFKSQVGIEGVQTPRENGFCAHSIMDSGTTIVEDARADDRFACNPLVMADPFIRFYAGAPLVNAEGHSMGTLCVIDREPRKLGSAQRTALETLARQVIALMELRRVSAALAESLEGMRALRQLLPICAWCKSVRNDAGFWGKVEDYIRQHTGTEMTHGICPDCLAKEMGAL